jgi:hypothetical protein
MATLTDSSHSLRLGAPSAREPSREDDMRALSFLAAFAIAAGLFWASILTRPPVTQARTTPGIDIREMTIRTNLPAAQAYDAF